METTETLRVIHFDRTRTVLKVAEYPGDVTHVVVPMRTIIADALRLGSAGLILSHNHPSGDPIPSAADIRATRTLARAVEPLDIKVHDHLISGDGSTFSFRAMGLL